MATNPYSYGSLGQRWTVGEPTSKSLLDVSRVKADANRWALEQLLVDPDDTANFVLTAPGLNIDSNTLYVDSVNNSVGFGLTNPNDYAFNGTPSWVASGGAGNASVIVVSGTTSSGYLAFADGTTGTDRYTGQIQYNHSTNTMSFKTGGGVEAMTINSAQDLAVDTDTLFVDASADGVGIGTSSIPANHQLAILGNYTAGFYRDYADGVSNRSYFLDIGAKRNSDSALTAGARILGELKGNDTDGSFYVYTLGGGTMNFRLKLDESGNMGLGVSPSAWSGSFKALQVNDSVFYNNNSGDTFVGSNYYYDGTNNKYINTDYSAAYGQQAGAHIFYTAPSGTAGNTVSFTERLRILSSGGITFNGDTAAANALDDYEEGTITPTLTPSTSGSITTGNNRVTLQYTKIGNVVHIQGFLEVTSVSSPVGIIQVPTGFTPAGTQTSSYTAGTCIVSSSTNSLNANQYTIIANEAYTYLQIFATDGIQFGSDAAQSIGSAADIYINITYIVA